MITVLKVLSNNAVIAVDDKHCEIVAVGRGIGFGKREGDPLKAQEIESQFIKKSGGISEVLSELVNSIPLEHLLITQAILQLAQQRLAIEVQESLIFALSDHINFAVQRHKKGLAIKNMLLWDIKKFYAPEFELASEAVALINRKLEVELPEDEAGFIALHLANAKVNDMQSTMQSATIIKDVLSIIKYELKIKYDESSLNYQRIITHLKFFTLRMMNNQAVSHEDQSLYDGIKEAMTQAWQCAHKINAYLSKNYNYSLSHDEIMFLTIHINRLRD